ncbi:hypothetical protein WMY93_032355 [Mugilogobius chulae]|uniref:Olfactory receptor n=1 Tax=Mugilogobius chulae TaxID=88201 RepID=A0AAW0MR96_9GOBI
MVKMNSSSSSVLILSGFDQLVSLRWLFFPLLLAVWIFVVLSDSLVLFVIVSRPVLHKPMFIFIAAVLSNSLVASSAVYPKLLSDLGLSPGAGPGAGPGPVRVSVAGCLTQAFFIHSLGSSSFMLLGVMALDRFLSVTAPLRYAAVMSPGRVLALLLFCWLCPLQFIGAVIALAARLPLCGDAVHRIYCDTYTVIGLSCPGAMARVTTTYGLLMLLLVLILWVCLFRSRSFSRKALQTCGPHIAVFLNYLISTAFDLLHRRVTSGAKPGPTLQSLGTAASFLTVMIPTVFNPLVYGLKVSEIHRQIALLLRR